MPNLDEEHLHRVRNEEHPPCRECKGHWSRDYCSVCDVFYDVGHAYGCSIGDEEATHNKCLSLRRGPR